VTRAVVASPRQFSDGWNRAQRCRNMQLQQVGRYLAYIRRGANTFRTAARDPCPFSSHSSRRSTHSVQREAMGASSSPPRAGPRELNIARPGWTRCTVSNIARDQPVAGKRATLHANLFNRNSCTMITSAARESRGARPASQMALGMRFPSSASPNCQGRRAFRRAISETRAQARTGCRFQRPRILHPKVIANQLSIVPKKPCGSLSSHRKDFAWREQAFSM